MVSPPPMFASDALQQAAPSSAPPAVADSLPTELRPLDGDSIDAVASIRAVHAPVAAIAPDVSSVSRGPLCAAGLHRNLTLVNSASCTGRATVKVLLLCTGPDDRPNSMVKLITNGGVECESFDVENGPLFDLTDDATWDPLVARVQSGDFSAAFASPPCTTHSKVRKKPGGPPPLRGIDGASRYGLAGLSVRNKELVRKHNLIYVRVAMLLKILVEHCCPWIFEQPAQVEGEVSALNMDEYRQLVAMPGVKHTIGIQCTFGAISSKPTSWVYHALCMEDMPSVCPHVKRIWFNDRTGVGTAAKHRPTSGKDTYSSTQKVATSPGVYQPGAPFITASLAAYPDLLNRFLVTKLLSALSATGTKSKKRPSPVILNPQPERRNFSESIAWRHRLRGTVEPDEKEKADNLAIGGLRDAAKAVSRLHTVQEFGLALGDYLRSVLLSLIPF